MNRIESLRKSKGWNQDDLAKLLNVKRAAVSKYETEKISLSAETIKKLCDIFDVSADYLLCFTDKKQQAAQNEQPEDFDDELFKLTRKLNPENRRITQVLVEKLIAVQNQEQS